MSDPTSPFPGSYEIVEAPGMVMVRRPSRRWWLHLLLLLLTILTTLIVGSRLEYNFLRNRPPYASEDDLFPVRWALTQPSRLLLGIPFSATLMLILLAHEMGHYFYCVRYRVYATLPFFIPAPTLIGTLGAFIRIKAPIRSRHALFDIGIAGPIAGFCVALPALIVALALSHPGAGMSDSAVEFSFPLVFHLVQSGRGSSLPLEALNLHPMAIAAWVGMFATALNLLPGGQLDGGHIVYALWPRAHRWISRITVLLLLLGTRWWLGWGVWAVLLAASGMRHPQVGPAWLRFGGVAEEDPWPRLGRTRVLLAVFAGLMLALTFMPAPFPGAGLDWHIGR